MDAPDVNKNWDMKRSLSLLMMIKGEKKKKELGGKVCEGEKQNKRKPHQPILRPHFSDAEAISTRCAFAFISAIATDAGPFCCFFFGLYQGGPQPSVK